MVATPHDVHRQIIEAAAIRGVHVLKEKPFATSLEEAVRIAEIAKASGIIIMNSMQRRLHLVYQSFWTLGQYLGEPFFVDARYHFFIAQSGAGWRGDASRAGGGCVLDMGYHLIDIIVWYFGLPDRICCNLSTNAEPDRIYDAEDTATIQFSYHSGLHGLLTLSRFYGDCGDCRTAGTTYA
jgi:predicted dehydrogenase